MRCRCFKLLNSTLFHRGIILRVQLSRNRRDVQLESELVFQKLDDRKKGADEFSKPLLARVVEPENDPQHQKMFHQEMERFLFAADQRELHRAG